jgi:hypothetical protein
MRHRDSTKLCARCGKRESLKLATAMETPRRRTYWLCFRCSYPTIFPDFKALWETADRVFRHAPLGA